MLDIVRWILMGILILFTCVVAPLMVRERIRNYPLVGKESLLWLSAGIVLIVLPLSGLDWLHLLWVTPTAYMASSIIDDEVMGPSFSFYYGKEDLFIWTVAGAWAIMALLSLTTWFVFGVSSGESSPLWFLAFVLLVFPAVPITLFVYTLFANAKATKCDLCKAHLVLLRSDPEKTPDERLAIVVQAGLARQVGHKCQDCGGQFCQECLDNRKTRYCPNCSGMLDWA